MSVLDQNKATLTAAVHMLVDKMHEHNMSSAFVELTMNGAPAGILAVSLDMAIAPEIRHVFDRHDGMLFDASGNLMER